MAYIYRYELKNVKLRNEIDLRDNENVIKKILEIKFEKNLKDIWIEKQYFEFKLYVTVNQTALRELGRMLKKELSFLGEKDGFCRMQQELYALIYPNANNEYDITFIDADVIEGEYYKQKSLNYFTKNSPTVLEEVENKGLIDNFYLDVIDTHINKQQKIKIFGESDGKRCFRVKGYHRRVYTGQVNAKESVYRNRVKLEICIDVAYMENMDERSIFKEDYIDYLEVLIKEEQTEDVAKKIENQLNLVLESVVEIESLNSIVKNKKMTFKVHNVGQALATSLAYQGEDPFIYFDYGMPYGSNLRTKPPVINMPTKPGIAIILSHVDKDHWFRLAEELNAYKCEWFIPNQLRKPLFNHKLAEIIVKGGTVSLLERDIHFCNGTITCGGISTLDPTRAAKHVHETGLAFRFEGYTDTGKEVNILIAGDQMYDYMHSPVLQQIDILVASHHGGNYAWSKRGRVPAARNQESQVVYSYGSGNTHRHPSKIIDYRHNGWNNSFHTTSGEFKKTILIR